MPSPMRTTPGAGAAANATLLDELRVANAAADANASNPAVSAAALAAATAAKVASGNFFADEVAPAPAPHQASTTGGAGDDTGNFDEPWLEAGGDDESEPPSADWE